MKTATPLTPLTPDTPRPSGAPAACRAGAAQALCLVTCLTMPVLAIMSLVPVLPKMLAHFASHPQHEWLVPMILTAPSIVLVLMAGPAGVLADRWGRRKLMIVSLIGFGALGALPFWTDDLTTILATRLVVGAAEAGVLTAANALMGDYFEGALREQWLARSVMLAPLIGSVYVLSGGALGAIDWHAPFLMYLIGLPVLGWVIVSLWEPSARTDATASRSARDAPFPWPITLRIGAVTIVASLFLFLQAVQHGRIFGALGVDSPAQIGVLVSVAGIGGILGGYFYSRLSARPVGQLLALLFVLYAVGLGGLAVAPNLYAGLAFDMLAMVGGGFLVPTLVAWALSHYAFEQRGRGMGIWNACFSLSQFLSAALVAAVGLLTPSFLGAVGVFGGLAAVLAIACWAGRAHFPRPRNG